MGKLATSEKLNKILAWANKKKNRLECLYGIGIHTVSYKGYVVLYYYGEIVIEVENIQYKLEHGKRVYNNYLNDIREDLDKARDSKKRREKQGLLPADF